MMNTRKMESLAKFIEKLPKKAFDMSNWVVGYPVGGTVSKSTMHTCGTACCIGGWQAVKSGYSLDKVGTAYKGNNAFGHSSELAANQLGLTYEEENKLFYSQSWPRTKTGKAKFSNTPKGAAARIRYMIKEGV
jgi:hypothetical protein